MIGPKSSNFIKVEFPQPVDTLLSLIEVIKDPKAFDKHLKAIKEYTDKANNTVETLAKAEEVEGLLADAKVKHDKVSKEVAEKTEAALKLVSGAEMKAATLVSDARTAANKILSNAKKTEEEAIQLDKDSQVVRAELKTLQSQLDSANQAHQKREADLDKREQEIQRKEAIFKQLG